MKMKKKKPKCKNCKYTAKFNCMIVRHEKNCKLKPSIFPDSPKNCGEKIIEEFEIDILQIEGDT